MSKCTLIHVDICISKADVFPFPDILDCASLLLHGKIQSVNPSYIGVSSGTTSSNHRIEIYLLT